MSDEMACVVCGTTKRIENHHVASEANDPIFVLPLCAKCHRAQTSQQYARNHPLARDLARTTQLIWWAMVAGVSSLLGEYGKLRNNQDFASLAKVTESLITGIDGTPSPHAVKRLLHSVGIPKPTTKTVLRALAAAGRYLSDWGFGPGHPLADIFRRIENDPGKALQEVPGRADSLSKITKRLLETISQYRDETATEEETYASLMELAEDLSRVLDIGSETG